MLKKMEIVFYMRKKKERKSFIFLSLTTFSQSLRNEFDHLPFSLFSSPLRCVAGLNEPLHYDNDDTLKDSRMHITCDDNEKYNKIYIFSFYNIDERKKAFPVLFY